MVKNPPAMQDNPIQFLGQEDPWRRDRLYTPVLLVFPGGLDVKESHPPAMWETWVQSLGVEDTQEEGMATYSSILTWRNPLHREAWWATVLGGCKELDTTEWLSTAHRDRKMEMRKYTIAYSA